ncbi:isoleucine--tRNA ligase [Mesomycoplasma bovoculi]|uniref:Isoleucine--tRNA ligase n=1 Tax=Mesomycoplasma bovoculi M165/69 TaxID=743966 RepID=W5UST8_9BACT|nr:isoleucine--tRNA ligase [Mesomycoplasma bovoculi]AHH45192.1 isoleucyl-tRNA synthetase [Mesomycoplasma bovoculi M165/69]
MDKNFYKNSLNIFTTDFSMKAELTKKQELFHQFWKEQKIYKKALEKNKNNKSFILHDGPPYANGDIHIGHALNKILKDIIVRYKTLSGFYTPFVPGWDTHGLPIENKVTSEFGKLSAIELRRQANDFANSQIQNQMKQFKELDLFCDFEHFYQTNDKKYEAKQLKLFKNMVEKGLIYRGLKPVFWSPSSQSALAEAEIEYFEHKSPSIFVAFEVSKGNDLVSADDKLIIWTTTPWTLVANSGVAVGGDFEYLRFEYEGNFYIVASELFDKLVDLFKWNSAKIVQQFIGKDLIGLKYLQPISKVNCPVVLGHHVTLESGSGLVHMAPLFGEDDFWIGKDNDLEMIMHVNDDGTFNEVAGDFAGLFYEKASEKICEFLTNQNSLIKQSWITHSVAHDWRTNKPVIYRGTPQWFVSVEKLKSGILEAVEQVEFPEDWLKKRLFKMISGRKDWIISRQRSWGVPIIIFYDEQGNPILDKPEIFDYVINLVAEHGSDIWFEKEADELLPAKFRGLNWTKENNILDVWFDSGSSFMAADLQGQKVPYDLYLEGSDQYRGWFNSSLINSYIYYGTAPYKKLLSHGFIVDGNGNKMSKSKGNGVSPLEIISKYGSDILKLWVANSEYFNDVFYSEKILEQNIEVYRKIRNTIRFLINNLVDYKDGDFAREGIHAFIANRINLLKNNVIKFYESYRFVRVVKEINNFVVDLSNFYLSITKDSLYADSKDNLNRRAIQKNLYEILNVLAIALAPILPITIEEVYKFINKENKKESIFLEEFFKPADFDEKLEEQWNEFFVLKDTVYKLVESAIHSGQIKRSNEAHIEIATESEFIKSLDLQTLLMVGKVTFGLEFKVSQFNSSKCQRCWNHFDNAEGNLCLRCLDFLKDYSE